MNSFKVDELQTSGTSSGNSSKNESQSIIDEFDSKHNKFENFGGLNEDGPVKPRKLNRCQTSILNPVQGVNQPIHILKNGHTSTNGRPVVVTVATCAFDAILNFYVVSYADSAPFKELVDDSEDMPTSICQLIKLHYCEKEPKLYNTRNEFLQQYYDEEHFVKKISQLQIEINCQSTLDYTFTKMCQNDEFLHSVKQIEVCQKCDTTYTVEFTKYIPVNMKGFNITNIQPFIGNLPKRQNRSKCEYCDIALDTTIQPNTIVLIETDVQMENVTTPSRARLNEVSPVISFNNWQFKLRGVIGLRKSHTTHFFLFMKRKNGNWEKFDDLCPNDRSIPKEAVDISALFYQLEDDTSKGICRSNFV